MTLSEIRIRKHLNDALPGKNDTLDIILSEGSVTTVWSASGAIDGFTEPEQRTVTEMDIGERIRSINVPDIDQGKDSSIYEISFVNGTDEMIVDTDRLPDDIQSLLDSLDPYLIGLERQSEANVNITDADALKSLLDKGIISKDTYDDNIARSFAYEERKALVEKMVDDKSYVLNREDKDIVEDHRLGLIDDDMYSMSVWYRRNVPDDAIANNTMISVKLKLSVWGLRIGGRFDTFEFIVDRDDCQMTDRSYCVHGTLFEGCGNYKAPDAARYTDFTKERTEAIFDYLGRLEKMGILGKNFSEPRYDCGFFDLYIRYEGRDSVHTKGTTEYPYFIKYLMYLMDAKESL